METPPPPSPRPGTPGLDVFKIAGRSISGFVHSFKTGDSSGDWSKRAEEGEDR